MIWGQQSKTASDDRHISAPQHTPHALKRKREWRETILWGLPQGHLMTSRIYTTWISYSRSYLAEEVDWQCHGPQQNAGAIRQRQLEASAQKNLSAHRRVFKNSWARNFPFHFVLSWKSSCVCVCLYVWSFPPTETSSWSRWQIAKCWFEAGANAFVKHLQAKRFG